MKVHKSTERTFRKRGSTVGRKNEIECGGPMGTTSSMDGATRVSHKLVNGASPKSCLSISTASSCLCKRN